MKQTNLFDEIIVDNFAGGGGASTGIELATGRPVAIAINHDPAAILLHKTNHPFTEHLQASVWDVDPVKVCRGRPVGLAWFSPDCKHFSKAKGKALLDRNIRGLAWIVLRWAAKVRPRVIMLENVEEFQTWGPVRKGKPVKKKAGQTFQKWKRQLSDLGYVIEHRELVAADYGAPTTRKRFCLVARCDGQPIAWPERTHAPRDSEESKSGKLKPWRSAAEIIDWRVPGYSIFASKQEIWDTYGVKAVRPLAPNTMRRIIRGVDKFTIRSGQPFIVGTGKAANLIEEQQREIERLRAENRWIPVTERLPENEVDVLILAERRLYGVFETDRRKHHIVAMAFYTDGKMNTEDSGHNWELWDTGAEYDEEVDAYIIPEGWWESVRYGEEFSAVDDFVTHWRPMPKGVEVQDDA